MNIKVMKPTFQAKHTATPFSSKPELETHYTRLHTGSMTNPYSFISSLNKKLPLMNVPHTNRYTVIHSFPRLHRLQ